MTVSYADLVDDHDEAVGMALRLIAVLGVEEPEPSDILRQLHAFAVFVREHIAVEDRVIRMIDASAVPSRWQDMWDQGSSDFQKIHEELMSFLEEWSEQAIVGDMAGFRSAATPMLVGIVERGELAARAVYAVALQTSQITLRPTPTGSTALTPLNRSA